MLRTLNSRAKLRSDMQGHELGGRTSLSNWEWDQATLRPASERKDSNFGARIVFCLVKLPLILPFKVPSSSALVASQTSQPLANEEMDADLPFVSSVQVNTPSMDAQETGSFRHRIFSGMNAPSTAIYQVARGAPH